MNVRFPPKTEDKAALIVWWLLREKRQTKKNLRAHRIRLGAKGIYSCDIDWNKIPQSQKEVDHSLSDAALHAHNSCEIARRIYFGLDL